MKVTSNTFYTYRDAIGDINVIAYPDLDKSQLNTFFRAVSYKIAYGDITDETVLDIYVDGERIEYKGWQPGMLYEYVNTKGEVVYSASFPHWDH